MIPRHILSLAIWLASTAGAVWLARGDAGVADAPAQILPQEFRIAAAETARLVELHAVVGQRVRAGDLLARLDTSVLEREIATGEAHLRQLRTEPGASAASMEFDGYASERGFQSDVDEAAAQLEAVRAAQAQQAAELAALREEIVRQRRLVKEGLTRADRVEELGVRATSIAESAAAWPARIDSLQSRLRAAEARLREWRAQHKPSSAPESREARLQPLVARIAEQQEALRVLRTRLAAARIVAPADGEVILSAARLGDVATAGVPFVILHGAGPRMLVAYVNERAQLGPGAQAVARRRTAAREELPTTVHRVADAVAQIPPRFWLIPTIPQWGREVYLELPATAALDAGEAVDIKFITGGVR
ncbi:MAG: biotin/lipoyl-binding protein [Acidobacteria bacterium]|nr:biotin/lipoyl-binding protein [Acidobacteriota bacterium]